MSPKRTLFNREHFVLDPAGAPLYEQLAAKVQALITGGTLTEGERLPTVRKLATDLQLSGTTITAAFALLSQNGYIRAEVGRGTFVTVPRPAFPVANGARVTVDRPGDPPVKPGPSPWRKRVLTSLGSRLRRMYPHALDCSSGRPDPSLLPIQTIRASWQRAIEDIAPKDLQYASPEPIDALSAQVVRRFAADNIPTRESDLVVANSAQQFMMLALQAVQSRRPQRRCMVAVEEPGYPTIMDAFEKAGAALCGVAVDGHGAVPASLEAALRSGADMLLLTPRAHNPTGASWTPERLRDLADVLASAPDVVVVEDDQFGGIASSRAGSLLQDLRLESRVIYIRSFSKSLGPDLRVAVGAARQPLRSVLLESKSLADGWTSHLLQRTVAAMLADPATDSALAVAVGSYRERREAAARALLEAASWQGVDAWAGQDGVNVWVRLAQGTDCSHVAELAAARGVLVAPGEPFFVKPGQTGQLRFNAGSVSVEQAAAAGKLLGEAICSCEPIPETTIHV